MKSSKVLEMLNNNQIEELKEALRDEVYAEVLASKPGAKQRFLAMKRFFRYNPSVREVLQKPAMFVFEGETYSALCNGFTLVLTKEPAGTIELCSETDRYPDVTRLVNRTGEEYKVDFRRVIAEAKSRGYKLKASAIHGNDYLMKFDGAYFRIGLLDISYSVIDNGEWVTVYHEENSQRPISFENDIGICTVMPVRMDEIPEGTVIIEVEATPRY